eukprot:scaffold79756_cov43-Prasinocladus_malaysianus.AAC.2
MACFFASRSALMATRQVRGSGQSIGREHFAGRFLTDHWKLWAPQTPSSLPWSASCLPRSASPLTPRDDCLLATYQWLRVSLPVCVTTQQQMHCRLNGDMYFLVLRIG